MESMAQTIARKLFSHLIICDTCRADIRDFPRMIHQAEINYDDAQIMFNDNYAFTVDRKIMSRRLRLIRRAVSRVHGDNPVNW